MWSFTKYLLPSSHFCPAKLPFLSCQAPFFFCHANYAKYAYGPHCNDILKQLSAIWSWVVVWPGNVEHVKTGGLLLRYTYLQVFSAKQNRTHGVLSEFLFPPDPPHAGIYFNLFHFYPNSSLEGGAKIPDECFAETLGHKPL